MRSKHVLLLALSGCVILAAADPFIAPPTKPVEVRSSKFPVDQAVLKKMVEDGDENALRRHAWFLLSLVTKFLPGTHVPQMFTWCSRADLFGPGCPEGGAQIQAGGFEILKTDKVANSKTPPGEISTIYFNTVSIDRMKKPMVKSFPQCPPAIVPIQVAFNCITKYDPEHKISRIDDFDSGAIATKLTWMLVKANADNQPLAVWDGWSSNPGNITNASATPPLFRRSMRISIRPTTLGCGGRPAGIRKFGNIPIERFYYVPLCTDDQVGKAFAALPVGTPANVEKNDFLVLVGFHIITKETPNWVWSTFWWHDHPEAGPYSRNRPEWIRQTEWGNYLMDTSLEAERPIFNPYMELSFPRGGLTSCIGCHQQAAGVFKPSDFQTTFLNDNDSLFQGRIRADLLWSIAEGMREP